MIPINPATIGVIKAVKTIVDDAYKNSTAKKPKENTTPYTPSTTTYTPPSTPTSTATTTPAFQATIPSYDPATNVDTSWIGSGSKNVSYNNSSRTTGQTTAEDYYKNMQEKLAQYQQEQKKAILNQLTSAYEESRLGLQGRIPGIQQNARDLRNQNDVALQTQYLPQLYAALEQSGAYRGGDVAAGARGLLTTSAQNLNDINLYEANQLQGLENALATLEAQKGAAIASAEQNLNSDVLAQQLAAIQGAQSAFENQQQYDLAALQQAYNQAVTDAGLTGIYKGQQTMQGAQNAAALQAQQLANEIANLQLQNMPEQLRLQLQQLQLNLRAGNADIAQAYAQINNAKAQLELQEQNQTFNQSQTALNNAINQIDSMFVITNPVDGTKTVNTQGLKAYILSLNLSDEQKNQLLNRYGLSGTPTGLNW